jgi:hypothetical protein
MVVGLSGCPPNTCAISGDNRSYRIVIAPVDGKPIAEVGEDLAKQIVESGVGMHQRLQITCETTVQYDRYGHFVWSERRLIGWSK